MIGEGVFLENDPSRRRALLIKGTLRGGKEGGGPEETSWTANKEILMSLF